MSAASLYADENFPRQVVEGLRRLGHDVLTCQEAGNAGRGVPDREVLAFAKHAGRAVLTMDQPFQGQFSRDFDNNCAVDTWGLSTC